MMCRWFFVEREKFLSELVEKCAIRDNCEA